VIGGPHGDLRPASTGVSTSNQAEKRASLFSFRSRKKGVETKDEGNEVRTQERKQTMRAAAGEQHAKRQNPCSLTSLEGGNSFGVPWETVDGRLVF
jgi:hypothetical protein